MKKKLGFRANNFAQNDFSNRLLGSAYPVRFGAFRDVIPFVDENDTTPVNLVGLTAGIGSDRDKDFFWDASVLYSRWEQVNDEGQKYSETLTRISISVTYHFNTN